MKNTRFLLLFLLTLGSLINPMAQDSPVQQRMRITKNSGSITVWQKKDNQWVNLEDASQFLGGTSIKVENGSYLQVSLEPAITLSAIGPCVFNIETALIHKLKKSIRFKMRISEGVVKLKMPSALHYKLFFSCITPVAELLGLNSTMHINASKERSVFDLYAGNAKVKNVTNKTITMLHTGSRAVVFRNAEPVEISPLDKTNSFPVAEKELLKIAMLSIQSRAVSKENLEPISDYIAKEIEGVSNTKVFFLDDVRSMLQTEGEVGLLNCNTDSCLSKIGSYLGVDLVVIGRLGQLGKKYLFDLKIVDVLRDKTLNRTNITVEDDIGKIIDEIPSAVNDLILTGHHNVISKSKKNAVHGINLSDDKNGKLNFTVKHSESVYIFPGSFNMGSDINSGDIDEIPMHNVVLDGFYIDKYEVTRTSFKEVMGYNPSSFKGCLECPVNNVSWEEANNYCSKIGARLPTEAEWEYAARSETNTLFNTGNTITTEQANFNGQKPYGGGPVGVYKRKPVPVGSFENNGWKLNDMHGNISEWCSDWYDANYYGNSDKKNPQGPKSGTFKVVRGGSWNSAGRDMRSSNRVSYNPSIKLNTIGFRCIKSAD